MSELEDYSQSILSTNRKINLISSSTEKSIKTRHIYDSAQTIEFIDKNDINSGLLRLMITRGEITGTPWNHEGKPGIYISIRPISSLPKSPTKVIYFDESNYPIIRSGGTPLAFD